MQPIAEDALNHHEKMRANLVHMQIGGSDNSLRPRLQTLNGTPFSPLIRQRLDEGLSRPSSFDHHRIVFPSLTSAFHWYYRSNISAFIHVDFDLYAHKRDIVADANATEHTAAIFRLVPRKSHQNSPS
jgi:hypothetical protein